MNFDIRTRFAVFYRGRNETLPEAIDSRFLSDRFHPAFRIQMTRRKARGALAGFTRKITTNTLIKRVGLPPRGSASRSRNQWFQPGFDSHRVVHNPISAFHSRSCAVAAFMIQFAL